MQVIGTNKLGVGALLEFMDGQHQGLGYHEGLAKLNVIRVYVYAAIEIAKHELYSARTMVLLLDVNVEPHR